MRTLPLTAALVAPPVAAQDVLSLTAESGPVASSTYRLHERHEEVAELLGRGPATPVAAHEVAPLRAVLLRVHVEFVLVEGRAWLLPAQFEGHLVWDRAADRPRALHLALPSRDTNYDLNYRNSIDIGHLPVLRVASAGAAPAGEDAPDDVRALAAQLAERYRYPVDFQVVDTRGRLLGQAEANRRTRPYRAVLVEALGRRSL